MLNAFENDPHLATDALVLGHSFKDLKSSNSPVYDWTPKR